MVGMVDRTRHNDGLLGAFVRSSTKYPLGCLDNSGRGDIRGLGALYRLMGLHALVPQTPQTHRYLD